MQSSNHDASVLLLAASSATFRKPTPGTQPSGYRWSLASTNPRNVLVFLSVSKVSALLWAPWRHRTCHRALPPLCRFLMLAMVPLVVAPKGETNA
jgi:hypothetical protein